MDFKKGDKIRVHTLETVVEEVKDLYGAKFLSTPYGDFSSTLAVKIDDE